MNGLKTRQYLDMAHEDRRQLILHTKISPLLREAFEREEHEDTKRAVEMLAWLLLCTAAAGAVGWVLYLTMMGVA